VRSFQGADLDVLLSVRDAQAVIPGQWQTSVHNRSRVAWPDYLAGVRASLGWRGRLGRRFPDPALRSFLQACDVPRMLATWSRVVPPERLHVLTVPRPGSEADLLWHRFAAVLGVDPASCPEPAPRDNASLGFASTELVRRVNRRLGSVRLTDYNGTVKRGLALDVLAPRAAQEGRAQLDQATREVAVRWNARSRAAITASGAHVVGDLADLPHLADTPEQDDAAYRPAPKESQVLDAAEVALEEMTRLVRRLARRRRRAGSDVPLPAEAPGARLRWASAADPVDAAAAELADLCRAAIGHRRWLLARRLESADETSQQQDAG